MPPAGSRRNLVNLEAVSKAYGTRALLDGVSLGVAEGDRIGVVGRNGGGKSTLLGLADRAASRPTRGRVTHAGGLRVAAVGQPDDLDPAATVRALVVGDGPAHEWAADPRVRDVLDGPASVTAARLDAVLDRVGRAAVRRRAAPGRAGPGRWSGSTTCSSSTSRPTTSTSRASTGWPGTWPRGARRWSSSPTTAGSSTPSAPARGRCTAARSTPTRAATRRTCSPRAERDRLQAAADARRRQPGAQGAGLAAPRTAGAHRPSRGSGSTPPTR